MTTILVVDDHSVYRKGLRDVIELKIENSRVIEASSPDDVDQTAAFDLILIDAGNLNQSWLNLFEHIHERNMHTLFAVMSNSNTRADVLSCLSAGFHGFVYKPQSDDELLRAITDLLSGRIYVPRWLADGSHSRSELPASADARPDRLRLTRRQKEILPLLAQGMSSKEIARRLLIAESTTKIHTAALLRALGARNRTEAAFLAARLVGAGSRVEHKPGNGSIKNGFAA